MIVSIINLFGAWSEHFPILLVVVPMLAAPLCVLFGSNVLSWVIAFAANLWSLVAALALVFATQEGAVLSYHVGGWAPPLGIEYRVDAANAFVVFIVALVGSALMPYAWRSVAHEIEPRHVGLFYAAYLLCFTGLLGVAITGDAFNIFVFVEISSLATYALVAMGARQDKRALSAAYDYLILGTIGATFFVIGLGFLYMATGTLNLADLAVRIEALGDDNRTVRSAFAFIVIGMGLKAAVFPLHRWLPGSYTYAPSFVSAFLAGTATKVAIYVILRFAFSVYSGESDFERDTIEFLLLPLAIAAMFGASLVAVFQTNLKRMLAYSSVGQIGYMLLGFTLLNATGVSAAMIHLFNHAITKTALFMAAGAMVYRLGSANYGTMAGLGRRMPWTAAAIVLAGLSLIGVPSTAGFVSKWVLIQAALEKGWWIVAVLVVISSLVAIVYVWRVVEVLYLQAPADGVEGTAVNDAPASMLVPIWLLVAAIFLFGFDASWTLDVARQAAEGLLAGKFGAGEEIVIGVEGR